MVCTHGEITGEIEEAGVCVDVGEAVEGEAVATTTITITTTTTLELYRYEDTGSKDADTTAMWIIEYYMGRVLYSSCARSLKRLSIRQNDRQTCTNMLALS